MVSQRLYDFPVTLREREIFSRAVAEIKATYVDYLDYDRGEMRARCYKLQYAIFPNGERVDFSHADDPCLTVGRKKNIIDSTGRSWYVELTNQRASR